MTTLRADLHVHTYHSKDNRNLALLRSRDCYSRPEDVYRVAKARGMDLVAITDHDTIDGALELLDRRPGAEDIIVGEEVSCRLPDGDLEVHFGVYGMTESLHREVQPLRRNAFEVAARLRQANVFFALNHLLHFYHHRTPLDVYLRLLDEVPALEVRNGTMLAAHNRLIEQIAARWTPHVSGAKLAVVAGSDAHTLRRVGTTWTQAPGRDRDGFLHSLRMGHGRPGGRDGSSFVVAGDAYGVIGRYVASLAGAGPRDHRALHRGLCLAFAAVSLPLQFLPMVIAAAGKSRERGTVRRVGARIVASLDAAAPDEVLLRPARA